MTYVFLMTNRRPTVLIVCSDMSNKYIKIHCVGFEPTDSAKDSAINPLYLRDRRIRVP